MSGGTFTITNGGVFGSLLSTPILNEPQSAILGMHAIQERPVAVNGQSVGEAELVAAYAGTLGVPTVLVSGDDVLGRDLETSMPEVLAVVVKRALGRYQTELVARDEVHRRLRSGAERALRQAATVKPFAFPSPVRLRVTFTHPGFADLAAWVPGTTRVEPHVVAYESDDFGAVFRAFTLMCATTGVAYYQQLPK
jgi:D-amino peptidase